MQVTVSGNQTAETTHGMTILNVIAKEDDNYENSNVITVSNEVLGSLLSKGHCSIKLYDKDNNLAESISGDLNTNIKLSLRALDGEPAGSFSSSPTVKVYSVDPTTFSTGKIVYQLSGKIQSNTVKTHLLNDPYFCKPDGNGFISLEIPFTVLA